MLREACASPTSHGATVCAMRAGSRRRLPRLGAAADGARRSRPAGGARQLRPGLGGAGRHHERSCTPRGSSTNGSPPDVETTLYRIAQEAMTNAAKHRGGVAGRRHPAAPPRSRAADRRGRWRGFDTADGEKARAGFGLLGMQERPAWSAPRSDRIGAWQGHDHPRADRAAGGSDGHRGRTTQARHPLRVLLADDHVTVRYGLKLLIDSSPT